MLALIFGVLFCVLPTFAVGQPSAGLEGVYERVSLTNMTTGEEAEAANCSSRSQ